MKHIIASAQKTIALEAASITALANYIDASFEKTVTAIHACKGRLVVSGVGKSAIIAQKIVATLNSTGTPALFMHAADAIHGDLGMIQPDDVVMLISKSGNSPEVKVLLPLLKGFGNTIIGMVGNVDSALAKQAHIVLNTTVDQEACPNNLAPTTSTTAQMVMGDALAVCLMELNEFSGRDFAKYHPGGALGKRLYLRVSDLSHQNAAPKVLPTANLKQVIVAISESLLGVTAVVNNTNELLGIITDGDIRRLLEKTDNLTAIAASDIMNNTPKTISAESLAVEALELIKTYDISQLVVTNGSQYLGILHLHDLVREGIL